MYEDRWIRCTDADIRIRGYYFPWGTKRIPYPRIRGVRRVRLAPARGRARIWGTANPGHWAHLDPGRPGRTAAVILDLGRRVRPILTPADPDAFLADLRAHTNIGAVAEDERPGPLI